jgi:hypothetical protein
MTRPKSSDCDPTAMSPNRVFTPEKAKEVGEALGVDWTEFDVEQLRMGMDVELEHGKRDPATNVTEDNPLMTGKIALAHLKEFPDYYTRLLKLEKEAKRYWKNRKD